MTVYQAGKIKRKRRTREQVEQLEQQIIEVLREDRPQSIRHVFYRMTDPRLPEPVEKSEQGYTQVQHRITEMRRAGKIPYHWINDATRRGHHVSTYMNSADFVQRMSAFYRADLWSESDYYLEVWTESRSLASAVEDLCHGLAVSLYPAGGFSSITLAYQSAEHINREVSRTGKHPVVLYIGDYDPAGVLIDRSLEKELRQHLDCDIEFKRIAITEEQIEEYHLPGKPRKAKDRRSLHVRETVEAEAMPAGILRGILQGEIESYLPPDALHVAKVAEDSEREHLRLMAEMLWGGVA